MTAYAIAGDVKLTCMKANGQAPKTVVFQCRDTVLVPHEFDYFVGPGSARGNTVIINVTHADGSTRSKEMPYDDQRAISTMRFNLWANVFLQKPLLNLGENRVEYFISKNGTPNTQGEFKSVVKMGGLKACSPEEFYSNNEMDCSEPYTYCQRYFQEKNYCQ
jgi:hypothetical protein